MPPFRSSRAIMRGGGPVFRLKLALRSAVAMAIVGGILFGSAGRTDLPFFWAYLAVIAGLMIVTMLTVSRIIALDYRLEHHSLDALRPLGKLPATKNNSVFVAGVN